MPIVRIMLLTIVCFGAGPGCSDPSQDPAKVPRAVANLDTPARAVASTPLANKPAEPAPAGDAAPGVVASVAIKPWSASGTSDNSTTNNTNNTNNNVAGVIQFSPTSTGMELSGALKNVPEGRHGLHIHENGDCSEPGAHFAPANNRHGDPLSSEHHAGDLGNIEADATNQAVVSINVAGLTLSGANSILGHAMVVHARADDMTSQPSGKSGDIIGCGIIEADGDAAVRVSDGGVAPQHRSSGT
jgi:superoxide dismutase, Cu-Zn family